LSKTEQRRCDPEGPRSAGKQTPQGQVSSVQVDERTGMPVLRSKQSFRHRR